MGTLQLRLIIARASLILLVCASIRTAPVQAQDANTLDFSWLTREVISRNAGLTARELKVKAMQEMVESAGALDDPRISYSIAPSSFGDTIPSNFGNALGVRQVIQFSQSFPWPGKRSLRTEEAEARADVAAYSYEELLLSLVSQSRMLWAQWWYTDEALATNARHRQLLTELEGIVATQYASGTGLQQDVLKTQTALVEIEHQRFVLEQEKRRIQSRLNNLLNQPPASVLASPGDLLPERELPANDVLRNWMLEAQPELLALEAEASAAQTRMELVEREDYPDIQLNMGYNELWNESALRYQVGLSINLPLDFGKRTSRKSAARYEYASTQSDVAQLKYRLDAELEQQLSRHDELVHNIALFETELLPKAAQTFRAASANYEGGGGNFATLVEAQQAVLDLNLHLAQMRAEKIMTLSEIDQLSGGKLWPALPQETQEEQP